MAHLSPEAKITFSVTLTLTEEEAIALHHLGSYDIRNVQVALGDKISVTFLPGERNAKGLASLLESAGNLYGPLTKLDRIRKEWKYDQEQG